MSRRGVWVTEGFESFRQGTFGNAGQNLYVSRGGALQRIHQFDLNDDGYLDLIFCNSQNHWEKPPAYVYKHPLGDATRLDLPAEGAWSGAVADLNGDGYDDLVIGHYYNGIGFDVHAFIYYGSPDGFSEQRHHRIPVPWCTSVAAGDFNGDGKPDLAFLSKQRLRLFMQNDLGFEALRFEDLDVEGDQLCAGDVDGDGYDDLVVRSEDGSLDIYWGGAEGLRCGSFASLPPDESEESRTPAEAVEGAQYAEYVRRATPLPRVICLGGTPHLFTPRARSSSLVPVLPDRQFGAPLRFRCQAALAVAIGDVNGDGHQDLVFACHDDAEGEECSWVYWGGDEGFAEARRTNVPTRRATDVVVDDLDGDGCDDVVVCQGHTDESFTSESLIYRGRRDGAMADPVRLVSHDARRIFVARPSEDGRPQVVIPNQQARSLIGDISASIFFGGPDGYTPSRRQDLPAWGAVDAICADFNDDGRVDVLLANAAENSVWLDPGSFVYYDRGSGIGDQSRVKIPTNRCHGCACADLNRDGYLDLIFGGFDNPDLLIVYGAEHGFDVDNPVRLRMDHDGKTYKDPRWIYLVDLNADGWLDLVVPQIRDDRSFILWGGPEGFSMDQCQALSVTRAACVRAADLTENGYPDLILGGHMPTPSGPYDSFVYVYWNGPGGLGQDRRTLLPAATVNAMSVGDFNGDGRLDLFVCSYHDGNSRDIDSYIYWNRPGRGFSAEDRMRLPTHSASGCLAADFDEDRHTDLAIAYHKVHGDHLGHSAVWWSGVDGLSPDRVTRLPTSGPHGMTSVEPGNILDRGPEEYYESPAYELPEGSRVTQISWDAEVPAKAWVRAQLRAAASEAELEHAEWQGPNRDEDWSWSGENVDGWSLAGRWIQYRLALGATNGCGTPRVTAVRVDYD